MRNNIVLAILVFLVALAAVFAMPTSAQAGRGTATPTPPTVTPTPTRTPRPVTTTTINGNQIPVFVEVVTATATATATRTPQSTVIIKTDDGGEHAVDVHVTAPEHTVTVARYSTATAACVDNVGNYVRCQFMYPGYRGRAMSPAVTGSQTLYLRPGAQNVSVTPWRVIPCARAKNVSAGDSVTFICD